MSEKPKRLWFKAGLPTLILIAVAFVGTRIWEDYQRRLEVFDGELWRDPTMIDKGVRLKMADGFVAKGNLIGLSRSAVVEMLGEPPPPEYFRDWDMVYRLGMERGFMSIDSEWLVIRLKEDRVIEYQIVRD